MKITQIHDETMVRWYWYDIWLDRLRHRFGKCGAWCSSCITEAGHFQN